MDSKNIKKSTEVDRILNQYEDEKIPSFTWLSRMSNYLIGTDKGKLRFQDVELHGECMFVLPCDFTDKITCVEYNKEKNVLFVGCKDGKLRIWKVPKEWRSKEINLIESEYEFQR